MARQGAAVGAPVAAAAVGVVGPDPPQGPNNYHWLHGESPPRVIEPDAEVEAPIQQPPITKEEIKEEATIGEEERAASSALGSEEAKPEPSWAEDPNLEPFGDVDYDPDDQEDLVEEEEEEAPVPGEGAAASSSAPAEATAGEHEGGFEKVVRKRGSRGGGDVKKKNFKRNFYQVGTKEAYEWLHDYTSFNCGQPYRLHTPYLQETPDFPPLVS